MLHQSRDHLLLFDRTDAFLKIIVAGNIKRNITDQSITSIKKQCLICFESTCGRSAAQIMILKKFVKPFSCVYIPLQIGQNAQE